MATGCVDSTADDVPVAREAMNNGAMAAATNFCHIFPPSTNQGLENISKVS